MFEFNENNEFTDKHVYRAILVGVSFGEDITASMEELEYLTLGALRRAVTEGDVLNGSVMAGQIAGMIHEETDCRTLIRQLIEDAEKRMKVWR